MLMSKRRLLNLVKLGIVSGAGMIRVMPTITGIRRRGLQSRILA
jgi:hypothetical protein